MSLVTTHVIDTVAGKPARGIPVLLEYRFSEDQPWKAVGQGRTDADGRINDLLHQNQPRSPGLYCLHFDVSNTHSFFPEICIVFRIADPAQHYHVPLLLSTFGYSTYRGS
jgi:5-hydroxyisourate hydrolase